MGETDHDAESAVRREMVGEKVALRARAERLVEDARALNATIAAQAQEIGRLRAADPGIEIAPGVRLVWQRGDVGVLTFEPGAVVPEESHDRDEAGVVLDGLIVLCGPGGWEWQIPDGDGADWHIRASQAHTMIAGPDGAIVGVRWVGAQIDAPTPVPVPAPAPDPPPFAAYMPVDGLSTEALADGLRALASSALRRAEASGRVKGIKITVIMERP